MIPGEAEETDDETDTGNERGGGDSRQLRFTQNRGDSVVF